MLVVAFILVSHTHLISSHLLRLLLLSTAISVEPAPTQPSLYNTPLCQPGSHAVALRLDCNQHRGSDHRPQQVTARRQGGLREQRRWP